MGLFETRVQHLISTEPDLTALQFRTDKKALFNQVADVSDRALARRRELLKVGKLNPDQIDEIA